MKQEIFDFFTTDNKSGHKTKVSWLSKNKPELYDKIINFPLNLKMLEIPFNQKVYNYIYELTEIAKCKHCGINEVNFREKISEGYNQFCSIKCTNQSNQKKQNTKKGFLEKYGVESHNQLDSVKEKKKETLLKNYGVENMMHSPELKEKLKKTNLERYGVECTLRNEEINEKTKKTNLEKYGVENPFNNEEIKNKIYKTNLEKYGSRGPMSDENVRKKRDKTNLEKYGVIYPLHNEKLSEKRYETISNNFKSRYPTLEIDLQKKTKEVIVKNHCPLHDEFKINRYLLYTRYYIYKLNMFCTKCFPPETAKSIKEQEIGDYIKSLLPTKKIIRSYIYNKDNKKSIDIFLPELNLGFECDGTYWHSILFKEKDYHINKLNETKTLGIKLYQIFEDEWTNKKEIVKSIIKSKFNIYDHKVYARKCIIKELDSKTYTQFLNENHIQGRVATKHKYGLMHNSELVAVIGFGKKRKSNGEKDINIDGHFELLRFCKKLNYKVHGGFSKLVKHFINEIDPKQIISLVDKRYFDGESYKSTDFVYMNDTEPGYWYVKNNTYKKYHRFSFRRDVLTKLGYDENKHEFEIMLELGYHIVYDSGNMRFVWNKKY